MPAIVEQSLALPGGGILYDASRLRKPQEPLFSREHWRAQGALEEVAGGRGSVCFLRTPEGSWVWRHYRRGGFVARMIADAYLWLGAARTRSFAEWRLLARLRALSLPVPAPIAAGYLRKGLTYRADLITEELPDARTLAAAMSAAELPPEQWRNVGRTIAAFHRQGVQHADLNAHNILLCGAADRLGEVYLIDFDRGRLRARGAWEQGVLARLKRSLEKVSAQRGAKFGTQEWGWLMDGLSLPCNAPDAPRPVP
jgi:3-deoxy-D-manno-octulosonic acid kinase